MLMYALLEGIIICDAGSDILKERCLTCRISPFHREENLYRTTMVRVATLGTCSYCLAFGLILDFWQWNPAGIREIGNEIACSP
jgi:hypothetical protein